MKFPKKIYVYVNEDEDAQIVVLLAAAHLDDIPEEYHGDKVATYKLKRTEQFKVRRILK